MMKRLPAVAALLLVCAGSASAQEQGVATVLTLDDAVARALATSHRLAEGTARREGAEATIEVRRASAKPTVAVSGGYTRTNHVDEFGVLQPNGALRVIYPDIPDNYFTRISLQWPIYTGGRVDALARAAAAEARAADADIAVTRADLRLEVVRAYWALATATESVRVLDHALARAEAHLRDVRSQFASGLVPPNEVSASEAQRSRQQMLLIESRNMRSSVLEELRRLTGISGDIAAAEPLEARPVDVATVTADGPPIARPEQQALEERLTAAEERMRAIEAGRKPSIAFTGAADYANPNPRIFPRIDKWNTSWELGVAATWTLWDSGRINAEVAEAAAAARAIRARQADVDALIGTDVRQRQLDLDSARASVTAAGDAVTSAEEARRVVAERFKAGVATSTDVLDAQGALLQAELDRTRALANIRLAEARLDRARGK
jgi:outer membrane protein